MTNNFSAVQTARALIDSHGADPSRETIIAAVSEEGLSEATVEQRRATVDALISSAVMTLDFNPALVKADHPVGLTEADIEQRRATVDAQVFSAITTLDFNPAPASARK